MEKNAQIASVQASDQWNKLDWKDNKSVAWEYGALVKIQDYNGIMKKQNYDSAVVELLHSSRDPRSRLPGLVRMEFVRSRHDLCGFPPVSLVSSNTPKTYKFVR